MKFIISLIRYLLFLLPAISFARQAYPVIGKEVPYFKLDISWKGERLSLSTDDFKGQHTLVYFFSSGCASAFENLPAVKSIADQFKDQLKVIMVGKDDESKELYEKFRKRFHLEFYEAYDPVLYKTFAVRFVPHILWIDSNGVVRAITNATEIKSGNIEQFISNKELNLQVNANRFENNSKVFAYDLRKPFLVDNNGGPDSAFMYRSLISKSPANISCANRPYISTRFGNSVQLVCLSVSELYNYAYNDTINHDAQYDQPSSYGIYYTKPVIEVTDKSVFDTHSFTTNLFCYSLILPKTLANTRKLQSVMQSDLYNFFGFHVSVETRTMPCWKITATDKARKKLATRGGPGRLPFYDYGDFTIKNQPVSALIAHLQLFHYEEPPIMDETGIVGNIDLHVDAFSNDDMETIRKSLQKHGLDIVEDMRQFKVIVIKD